ncbi:hypothetical protein, unlikely [Trypanosoma brucei gambiense DAL972]|uniref:Uncharacterized protein n=1 Tax=Trypanosoma brucei gambiense (strain MHOM/CI/86/DAL972) TaxID=679716 RepID=D0A5C5_TRYB9|nr:hypothetical protein, unlikely [Trypanosoma brucei gambiense DAL972]CBH16469.1 hypothetical protein, unlikely [Trypanosoma brucei gambiense DAL972]|eukprot:XP_011778733.1 hypothetical protein, unlikely [Trypanosoma brucei gambiense DAL972]
MHPTLRWCASPQFLKPEELISHHSTHIFCLIVWSLRSVDRNQTFFCGAYLSIRCVLESVWPPLRAGVAGGGSLFRLNEWGYPSFFLFPFESVIFDQVSMLCPKLF